MRDFLKSKIATVVLSCLLIFVMFVTAKILIQKKKVDHEIARLQTQVNKAKNDNDQLSSLIQYLNTPQYQEKAAREKLGLSKPGETVVVLPDRSVSAAQTQQAPKESNYKQWFDYFFNHDSQP